MRRVYGLLLYSCARQALLFETMKAAKQWCVTLAPRYYHLLLVAIQVAIILLDVCRFQKDVAETLQELGIAHSVEAKISHANLGPATVDILIERPGQPPMALEVDGPSHFMAVPPYRNLGHTALRNRLLKDRCLFHATTLAPKTVYLAALTPHLSVSCDMS